LVCGNYRLTINKKGGIFQFKLGQPSFQANNGEIIISGLEFDLVNFYCYKLPNARLIHIVYDFIGLGLIQIARKIIFLE